MCREMVKALELKKNKMSKQINIQGQKFGRLLVLRKSRRQPSFWVCQCSCGRKKDVYGGNLRRGITQSCGCLARETQAERFANMNADPEIRQKQQRSTRWRRSKQWHLNQSKTMKRRWAEPDSRARMESSPRSAETHKLLSDIMKANWQLPEFRARMLGAISKRLRRRKTPLLKARHHPWRQPVGRFTGDEVLAMMAARSRGETYATIGKTFRCSDVHVSLILHGKIHSYASVVERGVGQKGEGSVLNGGDKRLGPETPASGGPLNLLGS
jgi:hypothetical protein